MDDHPLERVLQFAYVAWPRIATEQIDDVRVQRGNGPMSTRGKVCQNRAREHLDVFRAAGAQRRHTQFVHFEAIVQVLSEHSARDRLGEVDVRRGDESHVELRIVASPEALHRPLLQCAQQLHLKLDRQISNLVEEDGAAARAFERTDAVARRTGECAAHVSEQLVFDQ